MLEWPSGRARLIWFGGFKLTLLVEGEEGVSNFLTWDGWVKLNF